MGQESPWLRDAETMTARAWRAADAGPESSWRCPLPRERRGAARPGPDTRERTSAARRNAVRGIRSAHLVRRLRAVADALESGRGFAIVHGPSEQRLSLEIQLALYWAVGQILGEPVAQNVAGRGSTMCATPANR